MMVDNLEENIMDVEDNYKKIDVVWSRYLYCIVWILILVFM